MNVDHQIRKGISGATPGVTNDAPGLGSPRSVFIPMALVLVLAMTTAIAVTLVVGRHMQRTTADDLQLRANSLARNVDKRLGVYTATLNTIAESYSLHQFDLSIAEWEARRISSLLGGWFILSRAGDTMEILMSTANEEGTLPPPEPRVNYPEVVRAEMKSLETGNAVVSDAFMGRILNEPVITIVKPLQINTLPRGFIYYSVTLRDITEWLEETVLEEGEFAGIADGARRVIARSQDNEDFLLAGLPEWYIAFSEGRDSGIAVGPPAQGGEARLFAMKRLEVAPDWTLAISKPMPKLFSSVYLSPWPLLSGLIVMLLGGGLVGLYLDRQRVKAQSAAREAKLAELRAADSRKSRLVAILAHDLRTPLVAMLQTLDVLRGGTDKSTLERMLKRVKADGHGMLNLIDDVLELARLGAGDARLRPEPFAAKELVNQIADMVRSSAERNGTLVTVQVDELPLLEGDVTSLRRVMMNFATNAVKATRDGSVQLSATLDVSGVDGHTVIFAVTDTGHGIAPEDIPRLFRDFGMLERDNASADGTGLGLAICRRLAAAMGGEVGVDSTLGKGSRFWLKVTLPQADNAISKADSDTDDPLEVLKGLRVLVAEDHDLLRQLTCASLTRAGMLPKEAADGEIAVTLAEAEKFDLILMDLKMPYLDGDEAAIRIRSGNGPSARARIICLTAHQSPEIALMLSDLAFDACLRKPLDLSQLAAIAQGMSTHPISIDTLNGFDSGNLTELLQTGGAAMLVETLKGFATEIETTRNALPELIARRDTFEAGRVVHKLVGFGDFLGARALSNELRKFEDLTRDDDIEILEGALETLDTVMAKVRLQLNQLIMTFDRKNKHEGASPGDPG